MRPFPEFGNVIQVVSDAHSRQDTVTVFFNASFNRPTPPRAAAAGGLQVEGAAGAAPPPPPPPGLPVARTAPLVDWRRMSLSGQYIAGRIRNNTDGDLRGADRQPRARVGCRLG